MAVVCDFNNYILYITVDTIVYFTS